jgi:hypothetical protein
MPLEINEIEIAMRVTDDDGWRGRPAEAARSHAAEISREDVIAECVRRVLRALKDQEEP